MKNEQQLNFYSKTDFLKNEYVTSIIDLRNQNVNKSKQKKVFEINPHLGKIFSLDKCNDSILLLKLLNKLSKIDSATDYQYSILNESKSNSQNEFIDLFDNKFVKQDLDFISKLRYITFIIKRKSEQNTLRRLILYFCNINNNLETNSKLCNYSIYLKSFRQLLDFDCLNTNLIEDTLLNKQQKDILIKVQSIGSLFDFYNSLSNNNSIFTKSVLEIMKIYNDSQSKDKQVSYSFFYTTFKSFGFRYCSITYTKIYKYSADRFELLCYFKILNLLIKHTKNFHMMFIDESSVCSSNFKKRIWKFGRGNSLCRSNLKYEKISMIGCISVTGVEGLTIFKGKINSMTFNNFIDKLLTNYFNRTKGKYSPILMMDNASCHRNRLLLKMIKRRKAYCVFNIPGHPQANPIEYFWEYVKREFRQMLTYKK